MSRGFWYATPRNEKTREKTIRHVTPTAEQQKENPPQGEANENKNIRKQKLISRRAAESRKRHQRVNLS